MAAIIFKREKIKCYVCGERIRLGQDGFHAELDKKGYFIYRHQNCQLWKKKKEEK